MKTKCQITTLMILLMITILYVYHKNVYEGFDMSDELQAKAEEAKAKAETKAEEAKVATEAKVEKEKADLKRKKCAEASKEVGIKCSKKQTTKANEIGCDNAIDNIIKVCSAE